MNTNTTLRACSRCGEECEAALLRLQHVKGSRGCPSCGFTARPSLFRVRAQPVMNGRGAHAARPDADAAGDLHARLCRQLDRVTALIMVGTIGFASADVVLALNLVRVVARLG